MSSFVIIREKIFSSTWGAFESHRLRTRAVYADVTLHDLWLNLLPFLFFSISRLKHEPREKRIRTARPARSSSWSYWHMAALQRAFEIISSTSAKRRALSAQQIYNSLVGNRDSCRIFYASSLNFINVMQTQAFQHIKLLMLCEYTLGLQILINIICMLICIFLISDIIYAHNFYSMMPAHGHIN